MSSDNTNQPVNSDELQSATVLTVMEIAGLAYDSYTPDGNLLKVEPNGSSEVDPVESLLVGADGWKPIVGIPGQTTQAHSSSTLTR
jgi:hypothetical protein